ncbi:hypothetical protein ABZ379_22510 [Streptomyces canus]
MAYVPFWMASWWGARPAVPAEPVAGDALPCSLSYREKISVLG